MASSDSTAPLGLPGRLMMIALPALAATDVARGSHAPAVLAVAPTIAPAVIAAPIGDDAAQTAGRSGDRWDAEREERERDGEGDRSLHQLGSHDVEVVPVERVE